MASRREILKFGAAIAVLPPLRGLAGTPAGDAQFYALLGGLRAGASTLQSRADAAAARAQLASDLATLRGFDPGPLSFEARLDYDGIAEGLALEAALARQFPFGAIGATLSPYVVSPRGGAWLRIAEARKSASKDERRQILADMAGENERLQSDATLSVVPPDFIANATRAKLSALRTDADDFSHALDAQIAVLQAVAARATHDAGVWRLRDGDAYYALALKAGVSLNIDPKTAHEEGLEQVRKLSARADVLLRKQGLTQGSAGARLYALGQDPRYLYSDDDGGRAKVVADMNAQLARVRPVLAQAFSGLSSGAISVRLAGPGRIGYREAPSYDGSKPGTYYVDLRDIDRRPSWSLPTVVHHETLPGHLLQLPLQERANPTPLRLRYMPNAYFEGWAIYTEQLADELGLLAGDDLARLGLLQSLLVRAGRLVIDTGIHFKRWSREEAIARFAAIAGDAPDTFENEVDRIVVQPGFTAGPALGRKTILDLRESAKKSAGFNLIAFHNSVLKRGQMRLSLLERAVAYDSVQLSSR
ncbi:MAG TPA: DUF885 family protein [Rhizomicrobium sp.]